jgi:serine phosphatase RsbU (regulator of sigma subunit)
VDQPMQEIVPTEPPLGIIDSWGACSTCSVELAPGSTLVVVSDGILEARNPAGEQFGVARTIEAIVGAGVATSATIATSLRAALDAWMATVPAADDQTLLIASLPRQYEASRLQ